MRLIGIFLVVPLIIFLSSVNATADEVWLKNGNHITGKVVRLENNLLVLNTSFAGEISIKWEEIQNLETEEPVKLVLSDDTSAEGLISPGKDGKVAVKTEGVEEPITIELAQLKMINPKVEPPVKYKARLNFGASSTSGNTDTQDIYGDGEAVARTEKNRFTIGGLYKRSETDSLKTADRLYGYGKYDRFISKKLYAYGNISGEQDEFKDLDLRTVLGAGLGYQFLETERTNLSFEAGPSYVKEDFIVAQDDDYASGRWAVKFDHFLWPKALQFFHDHEGLVSLEDTEKIIILSRTGLRVPLYKNLNTTFQVNWDWDNKPSPGKEREDKAYIFTIGSQWANF